jgi:hypothetical protein
VTEPAAEPLAEPVAEPAVASTAEPDTAVAEPDEAVTEPVAEPAVTEPVTQPVTEPVAEPAPHARHSPQPARHSPAPPLFADEVEQQATRVAVDEPATVPEHDTGHDTEASPARPRRVPHVPHVPHVPRPAGMVAAVVTGIVVGLGLVGLTWAGLRTCEVVRGTSSCGGVGYPLLAAIAVVMVVVGALLLRFAHVPEPASTSFLAVGLTAVVALLFLVDSLLDRSMVVVIPVITAVTFAAAHWVTRTFVEPGEWTH